MNFILASKSPRRKELLNKIGLEFEVIPAHINENLNEKNPELFACNLAYEKAFAVWQKNQDSTVIGSDTIVVCNNQILGKPCNPEEAVSYMKVLSGKEHTVISGIGLCSKKVKDKCICKTKVFFKNLDKDEIDKYIKSNEWTDKAGGYGIQGHASLFIEKIEGCYFNVVGFPVNSFYEICTKNSIDLKRYLKWD
ncbi:MAG: Maf family protein [Candidatus Muirbacterium halophilum]|nr:Maf family protein [Candidatus Muirbacterium halophilum]MCK9474403.1 Maf family protein [Candidatus Muirbacterium halophilum]